MSLEVPPRTPTSRGIGNGADSCGGVCGSRAHLSAIGLGGLGRRWPAVTDLVYLLTSRATLRQLAPQMLLSQPPARLACYARLLPTPWK